MTPVIASAPAPVSAPAAAPAPAAALAAVPGAEPNARSAGAPSTGAPSTSALSASASSPSAPSATLSATVGTAPPTPSPDRWPAAAPSPVEAAAALIFALALLHTFAAPALRRLALRFPRHADLWHLVGEVEVVFGLWAMVLVAAMALLASPAQALAYAESRQYGEPLFVFVVMVVAASRPIAWAVSRALGALAARLPLPAPLATAWLGLAVVPLAGSLVTEPAAMTLAALMLAPLVFHAGVAERAKYFALGTLFVNVSIGGTLTAFAAPPVLMVAAAWGWDSAWMLAHVGWKAALAVLVNASIATAVLRRHLLATPAAGALAGAGADGGPLAGDGTALLSTSSSTPTPTPTPTPTSQSASAPLSTSAPSPSQPVPAAVIAVHAGFLAAVVLLAHHPVAFLAVFLLFLGYTQAYPRHQSPLVLREALLVAFFLAGLVVLGGLQRWWLQPLVAALGPRALFFGAAALTAVTDNAALTYLGSLIEGLSAPARYALLAGAVAGGGLSVIANAPNPAGVALLRQGFAGESVGAGALLAGAALPTLVAMAALLLL